MIVTVIKTKLIYIITVSSASQSWHETKKYFWNVHFLLQNIKVWCSCIHKHERDVDACNMFQKSCDRGFSFNNTQKAFGKFWKWHFFYSFLIYNFSYSTVSGLYCCILPFIMCCTQFWTAGRQVCYSQTFTWKSLYCNMSNVTWNCIAEISRDVPEKDIKMAIYVAPKPACTF